MASTSKKTITDEERLQLAAKLDKELDEFIDSLEKKRYTDGWPEDRWQEEMENHPFFMKKTPKPGDAIHPLLEGIQQLKYDPNENTAEELASNYKEDGNFYIKHKKYRMSILCFTEGLKAKCPNNELNSILYNNRSAANFFLKNYRSSLLDAEKALELNANYYKARWRAARCGFEMEKFDITTQHCSKILQNDPFNKAARDLFEKAKMKKEKQNQIKKDAKLAEGRKITKLYRLMKEIQKRNIKFDDWEPNKKINVEELLRPKLLPLEDHPVHLDEDGDFVWPAAFSYPEFMFSDFQQQLSENVVMEDCINEMFSERLECDKEHKYRPGNLAVYYENRIAATVHKVDLKKTIKEIVEEKSFYVTGGSLLFYVVPKESNIELEFINQYRRPVK